MIRWVFLDIGGVILDEDVLNGHVFLRHAEAIRLRYPGTSILSLIKEREERALAGTRWPTFDLASAYLDEGTVSGLWTDIDAEVRREYADFLPPIDGAAEA